MAGAGRRRASSPWQTIAVTKKAAQVQRQHQPERRRSRLNTRTSGISRKGCALTIQACLSTGRRANDDDEGQEVERERHDPEQRHRGEVGGDVGGDREQQARRREGERQPVQPPLSSRSPPGRLRLRRRARRRPPPDRERRSRAHEQRQHAVAERPGRVLPVERQQRLDQQRIAEQRQQAAEIARAIEEVGVARRPDGRCAANHFCSSGAVDARTRNGRPRHRGQQGDQPQHGRALGRRRPAGPDRDRQGQRSQRPERRGGARPGAAGSASGSADGRTDSPPGAPSGRTPWRCSRPPASHPAPAAPCG